MPLHSLKILDFSTLLPGPQATLMLADMGAEVIRVEAPGRPELTRTLPPLDATGTSYSHRYLNRSKRSIGLDLKKPQAIEVVKRLIANCDILIEQFRPGVMDRLGIGYDTLIAINPRLIYCSITGFGQTGPYANRPGHDLNYLAIAGVSSYTGRDGQGPLPLGIQVADIAGGSLHAVTGILAAVISRQLSGAGQRVDISMTDAAFALNGMAGAGALAGNVEPEASKMLLNGGSFYDYYPTSDGRYFAVGSLEPQFRLRLFTLIGKPELAQRDLNADSDAQQPLKNALKEAFAARSFDHWQSVFADADACVEPVLSVSEAACHPQLQARDMVIEVPTEDGGTQKQIGSPIKFSRHAAQYPHVGPDLGAHTEEILLASGYDADDIEALQKCGALG
ncbi:MAG: alpha-methylacyl-CoA racemase [Motiliproteus sp.]|jgi:alpha-methylacyl-CoA racemase